jgi:hypothetical protein
MVTITPRPDNYKRTQDDWIPFWNNKGKAMLSIAETLELDDLSVLEIRKDFGWLDWLVTSSRVFFDKNMLVHNYGSTVVKQKEIQLEEIPIFNFTPLKEVLSTLSGFSFMQAVFDNSQITKEDIIKKLKRLSGKSANDIYIYTPSEKERQKRPVQALGCYFDDVSFYLYFDGWIGGNLGYSRGVINSAALQQGKMTSSITINCEVSL